MTLERHLGEDRLGDVVVAPPVGRALGERELVEVEAAGLGREPLRLVVDRGGIVDEPAGPALASISAIFSGLVEAGMTAMNGSARKRAKYASETAVDPLEASMMVVPSRIQPLHRP
jgi:hypothetical protein